MRNRKNRIIIAVLVLVFAAFSLLALDYAKGSLHKEASVEVPEGAGTIIVSIDAALWPAENNYYYFQSDKFGKLHFAGTFADHARMQHDIQKDWTVKVRKVGE